MHALEKMAGRPRRVDSVRRATSTAPDIAHQRPLPLAMYSFEEIGAREAPRAGAHLLDHYAPASTIRQADNQRQFREFARRQGIAGLQEISEGVCHQVLADKGYSAPGRLIVGTDSHTTTHGAFGAFSTGVGATDIACILKTGQLWFRVPEIMRIELTGSLPRGVYAKDVILHIIGRLGADCAVYRGVSFEGGLLKQLSVSERMCLCNMTTEMGAKAAYIQPDQVTADYLKATGARDYTVDQTDPG